VQTPGQRRPGNIDRALLQTQMALPAAPIWLNQTHSTIALPADPANDGQVGDAVFTHEPNRVCAILTADCLPLLVCNQQGTHVAAIHAGWRGLAAGVIESTIAALNLPPEHLLVWLGPAIGPQRFEVRQDVYDAFTAGHSEAKAAFQPISDTQWLADLYTLARQRLQKLGIEQVYGGEYCTYSNPEQFFSYRRDGKILGSLVNLIWIADSIGKL
jgi:YfiH family protein